MPDENNLFKKEILQILYLPDWCQSTYFTNLERRSRYILDAVIGTGFIIN